MENVNNATTPGLGKANGNLLRKNDSMMEQKHQSVDEEQEMNGTKARKDSLGDMHRVFGFMVMCMFHLNLIQ